jgi:hypothetical protein
MYKLMAAVLLALLAGTAAAYPADLEVDAGTLSVAATVLTDGRLAVVQVSNGEAFAVRCDAVFRNGPEVGRVRRAIIEPEDTGALTWMPRREVVRLRIELSCAAQDQPSVDRP